MKIAIIGAGFVGLSCAYHLLKANHTVTIFDARGVGSGASGIAAGLLHAYPGPENKKVWQADVALQETRLLLDEAAQFGKVADYSGIIRPALHEEQKQHFKENAALYSDLEWNEEENTLFIHSGITVDSMQYLCCLEKLLIRLGATIHIHEIKAFSELDNFDHVVVAAGASVNTLLPELNLHVVKGQILELDRTSPCPTPIIAGSYLVGNIVGATYEHNYADLSPDRAVAEKLLRPKMKLLPEEIQKAAVIGCKAGGRVTTVDKLPKIYKITPRITAMAGFGSKGLLYHGLYGRLLLSEIS